MERQLSHLRVHKMRIFAYLMNKKLITSNISAPESLTLGFTSKLNVFYAPLYLAHFFVKFFSISPNKFF